MYDTYFALLERPELRQIAAMGYDITHETFRFSSEIYSRSAGIPFLSRTEAYSHWVEEGRREGLEWAPGKDTVLKIVLKAKDETDLIDAWIAHHAAIVGYENIIILDCGSVDPEYLAKLNYYTKDILILPFRRYYDHVHAPASNPDFFGLLAKNCKYITILDADEFIVGRNGDVFSGRLAKDVLRRKNAPVFCGVWVNAFVGNGYDFGELIPKSFRTMIDAPTLIAGAISGKSIVRSDMVFNIGHLGHNLHAASVVRHLSPESFGDLVVFHLKGLSEVHAKRRIVKHLVAKGAVSEGGGQDVEAQINRLAMSSSADPSLKGYAKKYVDAGIRRGEAPDENNPTTCLINSCYAENLPALAAALETVRWDEVLRERTAFFKKGEML